LSIDFGEVAITTNAQEILTIFNNGSGTLIIYQDSLKFVDGDSNLFFIQNVISDIYISPGDSFKIEIGFNTPTVGFKQTHLQLSINDPQSADQLINISGIGIRPVLALSDSTIDFGTITFNTRISKKICLINESDFGSLTIFKDNLTIIGIDSEFFSIDTVFTADPIIAPKDTLEISLSFFASQPGSKNVNLRIVCNDPSHPDTLIGLFGESIAPVISVQNQLDFGKVPIMSEFTLNLSILNDGNGKLILYSDSLKIKGTDVNVFTLETTITDSILNPGDSLSLELQFYSTQVGIKSAILQIGSNDPSIPNKQINLSGTAVDNDTASIKLDSISSSSEFVNNQTGILSFKFTSNNTTIDSAALFIRKGGESVFEKESFTKQGSTDFWQAQIDSNLITERGTEYFVRVYHGWISTDKPQDGVISPNAFPGGNNKSMFVNSV